MSGKFLFKEGDGYSFERFISSEDVRRFSEIVGDVNPIHIDSEFAEKSFFKKRVVHGAFPARLT